MRIEWRDDLAIGVPSIDDQHRELFSRFNRLIEACNDGRGKDVIADIITFLRDYVTVHFCDEEELQREIGYPDRASHQEQHRYFVDRLSAMETEFLSGGASLPLVIKTNNLLVEWLITHISRTDRKVGVYLHEQKGRDGTRNAS